MSSAESTLSASKLLPWHARAYEQLQSAWRAQRLSHALMIYGAEGVGKRILADWLARALLCEETSAALAPCGKCAGCALTAAGTHPDLVLIHPEEDKQQISVEQVREASARLALTSYRRGYKVAIVDPAHQLTVSAANSLLKTLEEPAPQSVLMLVTSQPAAMLATIRSRCQKIAVPTPPVQAAQAWLKETSQRPVSGELLAFAGGAPLKALTREQGGFDDLHADMSGGLRALLEERADVTHVANAWADEQLNDRLTWLDVALSSAIRAAFCGTDDPITRTLSFPGLPTAAIALNITGAYALQDRIRELKGILSRTALQRELALDNLLIQLMHVVKPR